MEEAQSDPLSKGNYTQPPNSSMHELSVQRIQANPPHSQWLGLVVHMHILQSKGNGHHLISEQDYANWNPYHRSYCHFGVVVVVVFKGNK